MRPLLGVVLALTLPRLALADVAYYEAERYTYRVRVEGNTVMICLDLVSGAGSWCGDGVAPLSTLYRQDTRPDVAAMIPVADTHSPQLCQPPACCRECYIDECVPPGTYRYGMAPPAGPCGQYYGEATVTAALATECAQKAAPKLTSVELPWDGVAINDRPCPSFFQEGCALGGGRAVLGCQVLLFLIGLAAYLVRRRRT